MTKKGILDDIFSKARFSDKPSIYKVIYRDYNQDIEMNLDDFILESNNFQSIPASRIKTVIRKSKIVFQRRSNN
ncbi:DUF504 domain-containing protein [Nitrosopumilus sp. b1]|uniref:DUF504 domain-containing protein n=1 Tax=Nitrosopumilus sp. b1 TaxID=2109907 RepID=UPI0015F69EB1|nr:DUF504 domain-containing protein [Nitrosopumilus sp. b1]